MSWRDKFDWGFQWGRVPLNHPFMIKHWDIYFYGICVGEIGIGIILRRDRRE